MESGARMYMRAGRRNISEKNGWSGRARKKVGDVDEEGVKGIRKVLGEGRVRTYGRVILPRGMMENDRGK